MFPLPISSFNKKFQLFQAGSRIMKAYSLIFVIAVLIYDVASKVVFVKAFDQHHRFSQVGKKKTKKKSI